MKMKPMKSKIKGIFITENKSSFNGRNNLKAEELEIRPGGMLVQKRNSDSHNQINSVPISNINVRVKYGSSIHQICINSQASFGELKKMLAQRTGIHHQDQKLIYKKKERDSKSYLDIVGVKNGSKLRLIEDITNREKRCLEMLKSARIEKASRSLLQISSEIDKLSSKVMAFESASSRGEKVAELDLDNLVEILMNKLVALDEIIVDGDLKLQKRMQEKRVQKYIETLDILKLQKSNENSNKSKNQIQKPENSNGKMPIQMQKKPVQAEHKNEKEKMPMQQQKVLRNSESFLITTKWETFD